MKVLLITNFASHYRAAFFEHLSRRMDVEFIFFSEGTEPYWQPHLGTTRADVRAETITGRRLRQGLNYNPALTRELWRRDYDVMIKCINGRMELSSAYAAARARDIPFVLWMTIWWHPMNFLGWFSYPFLRAIYRGSDAVVTDGPQITRFVEANGIDPDKIFTTELSVDNELFLAPVDAAAVRDFRDRVGADGRPLILAVSRLVPEKGLDVLVRAAVRLSDLKPVIAVVGTGPWESRVRALARTNGVDVRLVGGLPPREMPAVYEAADVYTMPSVTIPMVREPWGLGVNEALCRTKPVVVTDAVGAAAGGLCVHRETGLVVPERDPDALARALREMLENPELASRLAEAGNRRVRQTNLDAVVDRYVAAVEYAKAVHGPRKRHWGGRR